MKKINREFRLMGIYNNRIIIQNDITQIDFTMQDDNIYVVIYGRKTGSKKYYFKHKYANTIPKQYKDIIDSYLVMHKLTL